MSQHDNDNDFLDKLYARSAKEQPPTDLNKHILEQAKAQHQHKRFASTLRWQRIVSVAAVMVFSIYIFFDVRHDRPAMMDESSLPAPKNLLKPAPSAPTSERLERSEEGPSITPMRQLKQKAAKQAAEPAFDDYASDDISDSVSAPEAEAKSQFSASELSSSQPSANQFSSSSGLDAEEAAKTEQNNGSTNPEDLLTEITKLLKAGKKEEAKTIFEGFKNRFPDYPVPSFIDTAFETSESK